MINAREIWWLGLRYIRTSPMLPISVGYTIFMIVWLFVDAPSRVCSGLLTTNAILNNLTLLPIGGLAAGSWMAIRESRSGMRQVRMGAAGRGRFDSSLEMCMAVLLIVFPPIVTYLVATVAIAAGSGCDGTVNGTAIAATALGVAASVPIGYWVGFVFPYLLTAPVLVAVGYIYLSAISGWYGDWDTLLYPITSATMSVFYSWRSGVFLAQIPFFVGVLTMLVCVRAVMRRGLSKLALAVTLSAAVLSVVGAINLQKFDGRWEETRQVASFVPYCASESPTICVHPAFRESVPELVVEYRPFMARVNGSSLYAEVLEQRPRSVHGEVTILKAQPFRLDNGDDATIDGSLFEYIEEHIDSESCSSSPPSDPDGPPRAQMSEHLQIIILDWLIGGQVSEVPGDRASTWFAGLNDDDRRAWFKQHELKFIKCELTDSEFE